jgi:hypothetical protein
MAKALAKNLHPFSNLIQSRRFRNQPVTILKNEGKNSRDLFYPAFWVLMLACFAGIGFRGLSILHPDSEIDGAGPDCSTDALLKTHMTIAMHRSEMDHFTPEIDGTPPNKNTDASSIKATQFSGVTQKILHALDRLPPTMHPIVVFWPDSDGDAIIGYQIFSYLSWPRRAWPAPTNERGIGKAVGDFKKSPFSAMVFYNMKPPAAEPNSTVLGPITIVRLEQEQK